MPLQQIEMVYDRCMIEESRKIFAEMNSIKKERLVLEIVEVE